MSDNHKGTRPILPLYDHWTQMSPEESELILSDFSAYCELGKIIIDKQGHACPFRLNAAQKLVAKQILDAVFAPIPEPIVLVIQKARQQGISVLLSVIEQYIVTKKSNVNLTHIFPSESLASTFYNEKWLPLMEGTHPDLLPSAFTKSIPTPYIRVSSYHDEPRNCNVRITGSESRAAGRGLTNNVVILDEYAFMHNVNRLERGILASMPKTGLSVTIYVSTANGSNHFYDMVKLANQPGSRIKHLFLPWYILDEYELPIKNTRFDDDFYEPTNQDMEILREFEKHNVPEEKWLNKLAFYDYTLEKEGKGDLDVMRSEYPTTQEESFLATGHPVFPAKIINYWNKENQSLKPTYIDQFYNQKTKRAEMYQVEKSSIRQFAKPIPGHKYTLSIDPSSGYAADKSAGVVIDTTTMEEVAAFVELVEQPDLAELAVNLATYYNKATIVIERNMGETCIEFIKQLNYPRIYLDTQNSTHTIKYGIRTTAPVKMEAIKRLRFLLLNGIYKPRDAEFLKEVEHFNWTPLPSGGFKAEATGMDDNGEPFHDDQVMARVVWAASLNMNKFKKYIQQYK